MQSQIGDHAGQPDEQGFLIAAEPLAFEALLGAGPSHADQLIQADRLERDGQLGGRDGFASVAECDARGLSMEISPATRERARGAVLLRASLRIQRALS